MADNTAVNSQITDSITQAGMSDCDHDQTSLNASKHRCYQSSSIIGREMMIRSYSSDYTSDDEKED